MLKVGIALPKAGSAMFVFGIAIPKVSNAILKPGNAIPKARSAILKPGNAIPKMEIALPEGKFGVFAAELKKYLTKRVFSFNNIRYNMNKGGYFLLAGDFHYPNLFAFVPCFSAKAFYLSSFPISRR